MRKVGFQEDLRLQSAWVCAVLAGHVNETSQVLGASLWHLVRAYLVHEGDLHVSEWMYSRPVLRYSSRDYSIFIRRGLH